MTVYFLDSSALIKRYVTEIGSGWVQSLTSPASESTLIVVRITWVEVCSAFARLLRESALAATDVNIVVRAFLYDWETQYQVVELDDSVANSAGRLLFKHPLRAYDSVQLAAALKLQPAFSQSTAVTYTFIAADNRLLRAAGAEGLHTDNPHNHP